MNPRSSSHTLCALSEILTNKQSLWKKKKRKKYKAAVYLSVAALRNIVYHSFQRRQRLYLQSSMATQPAAPDRWQLEKAFTWNVTRWWQLTLTFEGSALWLWHQVVLTLTVHIRSNLLSQSSRPPAFCIPVTWPRLPSLSIPVFLNWFDWVAALWAFSIETRHKLCFHCSFPQNKSDILKVSRMGEKKPVSSSIQT